MSFKLSRMFEFVALLTASVLLIEVKLVHNITQDSGVQYNLTTKWSPTQGPVNIHYHPFHLLFPLSNPFPLW